LPNAIQLPKIIVTYEIAYAMPSLTRLANLDAVAASAKSLSSPTQVCESIELREYSFSVYHGSEYNLHEVLKRASAFGIVMEKLEKPLGVRSWPEAQLCHLTAMAITWIRINDHGRKSDIDVARACALAPSERLGRVLCDLIVYFA
jgi:hypothetical protein